MTVPVLTQWVANAVVVLLFPAVFHAMGQAATFGLLAVACLAQAVFTWVAVPETRNRSLEAIPPSGGAKPHHDRTGALTSGAKRSARPGGRPSLCEAPFRRLSQIMYRHIDWGGTPCPNHTLTEQQIAAYYDDGYLLLKTFFSAEVIAQLRTTANADKVLDQAAFGRADGEGGTVRLSLWNHPTDTIYGAMARSRSLVEAIEQLLGDEIYHYHSKMVMKDARIGGAWAWHQDYGYWYQNGVLKPDLCSAFIAIDPCTRENGCLQVIRGSHHLGRLDHQVTGAQAGIDPERLAAIEARLETVHVVMSPGDLLLFHPNTLHRSDQNRSYMPRWSLICCYNAAANSPYKESHHPSYTRLDRIADGDIHGLCRQAFQR